MVTKRIAAHFVVGGMSAEESSNMPKVHGYASTDPVKQGHDLKAFCPAVVKRAQFAPTGEKDLRFSDLKEIVTCTKCLRSEDPKLRYYYGIYEGDPE